MIKSKTKTVVIHKQRQRHPEKISSYWSHCNNIGIPCIMCLEKYKNKTTSELGHIFLLILQFWFVWFELSTNRCKEPAVRSVRRAQTTPLHQQRHSTSWREQTSIDPTPHVGDGFSNSGGGNWDCDVWGLITELDCSKEHSRRVIRLQGSRQFNVLVRVISFKKTH
jgi:hypothetical protein